MNLNEIRVELFKMQDMDYRDFNSKLIPTVDKESMIGIRTPDLRKYAKQLGKSSDVIEFLQTLPHKYFDENQLHAFIISEINDFKNCIDEINRFLPYIDNWATCDQLSPKVFKKHHNELFEYIKDWLKSDKVYTLRFGIGCYLTFRYSLNRLVDSFCRRVSYQVIAFGNHSPYIIFPYTAVKYEGIPVFLILMISRNNRKVDISPKVSPSRINFHI